AGTEAETPLAIRGKAPDEVALNVHSGRTGALDLAHVLAKVRRSVDDVRWRILSANFEGASLVDDAIFHNQHRFPVWRIGLLELAVEIDEHIVQAGRIDWRALEVSVERRPEARNLPEPAYPVVVVKGEKVNLVLATGRTEVRW